MNLALIPQRNCDNLEKEAFSKMYKDGDSYGNFNASYLYALEGATRDCNWSDIPNEVKEDIKSYAQELQKKTRTTEEKKPKLIAHDLTSLPQGCLHQK